MNGSTWTQERIDRLKFLADGTRTASQIGDALGISRGAVIGKIHRMLPGLMKLTPGRWGPDYVAKPRKLKPRRERMAKVSRKPRSQAMPTFVAEPIIRRTIVAIPERSLDLPLTSLDSHTCRWPYGDGPFVFCGHAVDVPAVYCPAHVRISVGR